MKIFPPKAKAIKIAVFLLIVGVIIVILRFGFYFMFQKPDLPRMFPYFFETPIENVKIINAGGMGWLSYDLWIKFTSNNTIVLKNKDKYVEQGELGARCYSYLLERLPRDKNILNDVPNLKCLYYSGKDEHGSATENWLLYNKEKSIYYFVSWGG